MSARAYGSVDEKKPTSFLLFLKQFFFFFWETDLLVALGDFTVKNVKFRRGIGK